MTLLVPVLDDALVILYTSATAGLSTASTTLYGYRSTDKAARAMIEVYM